jgi:hypothetical protein
MLHLVTLVLGSQRTQGDNKEGQDKSIMKKTKNICPSQSSHETSIHVNKMSLYYISNLPSILLNSYMCGLKFEKQVHDKNIKCREKTIIESTLCIFMTNSMINLMIFPLRI